MMRALIPCFVLAISAPCAHAQVPRDSARLRLLSGGGWHLGRVVRVGTDAIVLRSGSQDQPYQRDDIGSLQVWRPTNCSPGTAAFWGALEGAAVFAIGAVASPNQRITGSVGGDAAVGSGAGALLGLALTAAIRGHWHHIAPAWLARRDGPYNEAANARADIDSAVLRAATDHRLVLLDFGAN